VIESKNEKSKWLLTDIFVLTNIQLISDNLTS